MYSRLMAACGVMVSLVAIGGSWVAAGAAEAGGLTTMPVREVTIFKDGHAFLLHEGQPAPDANGNVVLDYVPTPVMGTFWPHSTDKVAKLRSVVAGSRQVTKPRKAASLTDLVRANIGEEVVVTDLDGRDTKGKIVRVAGDVVLVRNDKGVRVIPMKRIREVTLPEKHNQQLDQKETRNVLTFDLDWGRAKPGKSVRVGMVYIQRGIRWIPSYRIDIDGKGKARVRLQATLVNDLADLKDVTAHLVIGVPTILFAGEIDPISVRKTAAALSRAFRSNAVTGQYLSNAITTQVPVTNAFRARPRPGGAGERSGDAVTGAKGREDLFIFSLKNITLAKGRRMVLPVCEFELPYKDVYTLDVPITPPPSVWRSFNSSRRQEYIRRFHAPKAIHKIRMTNRSEYPITTAPAVILRDGRLIAQGMTRYTPVSSRCDVALTTAVNVTVEKSDRETKRTPNAMRWQNSSFSRSDLEGTIGIVNHTDEKIALEVTRSALGLIDEAGQDGEITQLNMMEDPTYISTGGVGANPYVASSLYWWHWYSWPSWWMHLNGAGRVTWKLTLPPGKKIELTYKWHYFWG